MLSPSYKILQASHTYVTNSIATKKTQVILSFIQPLTPWREPGTAIYK